MLTQDEVWRVKRGGSATTRADDLSRLAADPSVTVRATLALNPLTPPDANHRLADDPDESVRTLVAHKLAALVPTLSAESQAELRKQALATLLHLVEDEAVRVRAVIAHELQRHPEAPREVILRLAEDPMVTVHEPVILFSPLLTDQDLIALVISAPQSTRAGCVARRSDLAEPVADAIAETQNNDAIRALLGNNSAHIREATLDRLAGQAVAHPGWQEIMVRRTVLPARASRILADTVGSHLLRVLAARTDLDPTLAEKLRGRLSAVAPTEQRPPTEVAMTRARELHRDGLLTETTLVAAVRAGDTTLASALLATKAEVPFSVVERAAALRSAKALTSLSWKAGFTMRAATAMQAGVAHLPPAGCLRPTDDGGFPLTNEEMRWQIEFLTGAATQAAIQVSGEPASQVRLR